VLLLANTDLHKIWSTLQIAHRPLIAWAFFLTTAMLILSTHEGAINIGDRVSINNFCGFYGYGNILIAAAYMIAPGVKRSTTARPRMNTADARHWGTIHKDVPIAENVWVGINAVVLPGTFLGARTIVGAGAVVTRDNPAEAVGLDAPACAVSATPPPAR